MQDPQESSDIAKSTVDKFLKEIGMTEVEANSPFDADKRAIARGMVRSAQYNLLEGRMYDLETRLNNQDTAFDSVLDMVGDLQTKINNLQPAPQATFEPVTLRARIKGWLKWF